MADWGELEERRVSWVFEPFDRKPFDIFFLGCEGRRFVGRKLPAVLPAGDGEKQMKCCLISANMILGMAEREQVSQQGVTVFYRPLDSAEKERVINSVKNDPSADLYYPYSVTIPEHQQAEKASTREDYWIPTAERVRELNEGEEMLREYTIELLSRFDLKNKVVYDPACSTGAFLHSIKENFPLVHTIGQDLSKEMVEYCRGRVDELYCGDSSRPPIKEESVDFIFFRFLNICVVNALQAHELFLANARCCRTGGYIILFGHTPVILSSEWLEALGFKVERRTGFSESLNSIFQYYILRKTGPLTESVLLPLGGDSNVLT